MSTRISSLSVRDIRFPTSRTLVGSDAINKDPDYSAAYVTLETDDGSRGYGLIFTIGRGNDICCGAVEAMSHLVVGRDLNEITSNLGRFCADLRADSQLRWLGPEKGVIHMAAGSIINSVWDLWARREGKPVWRLASDLSPEQFVDTLDFRYLTDVLTREEALSMVRNNYATRQERIDYLERHGYPSYSTSAGWLGYDDQKLVTLCREAVAQGFRSIKLKVGENLQDDIRRCRIARETVGDDVHIMIDANQAWEVDQAIEWVNQLAEFKPLFIEEPTSPDDLFGHRKIKRGINGVKVATGEHCHNRIMFKQFIANDAIDVVQVDACRLAGLSEMLAVGLMAAKFGKPVCPHAGGVGLCEYVQHFSMIDYVMISASLEGRMAEYVEHLHEHFEDPCVIRNGSYVVPTEPGYSIKMREETLTRYEYPTGSEWQVSATQQHSS